MPEARAFETLAAWLARRASADAPAAPHAEPEPPAAEPAPPVEIADVLRDARLFRARLSDAVEAACDGVLRELACAVLGRELLLAPADVARIAAGLCAHRASMPLRLRVAPDDAARIPSAPVPLVADPALAPGDVALEFADGCVDARLGVRLAAVLEAWS